MTSGLKSSRESSALVEDRKRLDIDRVVVIGRRDAHRRLVAHAREHAKHLVAHGRGGGRAVLRIERDHKQALAAARHEVGELQCERGIAVAHRPVDHELRAERLERAAELLRLRAGDGLERGFVLLVVPDLGVVARLAPRPDAQDDAVEHELPQRALVLDHPRIAEEFLEVAAHGLRVGGVGGAEIDQQHADLAGRRGGGLGREHGGFGDGQRLVHHDPM